MTKIREVYHCPICDNIVEVLHEGAAVSCCGRQMELMQGNSTDIAREKHVPVIEIVDGGFRVTVGATKHPMVADHYIQWIELHTPMCVLRRELHPGENSQATFLIDLDTAYGEMTSMHGIGQVFAREYCNIHGLWTTMK